MPIAAHRRRIAAIVSPGFTRLPFRPAAPVRGGFATAAAAVPGRIARVHGTWHFTGR
ncbi:protein of unknown function [Burkholderia multivorans]